MVKKRPTVVAIAAVSGGGKTTIATCLKNSLTESKVLHFDEYDLDGPDNMTEWIDNGCNPDDWDLAPFIQDLKVRLNESLNYIVLDFPFSYLHSDICELIDFSVFIDTPLDLAMARRISRDFKSATQQDILHDLENYIHRGRQGYLAMLNTIKPNADFIVDGTLPVSVIAKTIIKYLVSRK
jgi:uridine kinase